MGLLALAATRHVDVVEHGGLHTLGLAVHEVPDLSAAPLGKERESVEPGNLSQRRVRRETPAESGGQLLQRLSALSFFPLVVDDEEDGEPDEQDPGGYDDQDGPHRVY